MKVQMLIRISGTRNGVDWPAVGGEIEVSKGEAERLISAGFAAPVSRVAEVKRVVVEPETAVAPRAEAAVRKSGLTKGSTGL